MCLHAFYLTNTDMLDITFNNVDLCRHATCHLLFFFFSSTLCLFHIHIFLSFSFLEHSSGFIHLYDINFGSISITISHISFHFTLYRNESTLFACVCIWFHFVGIRYWSQVSHFHQFSITLSVYVTYSLHDIGVSVYHAQYICVCVFVCVFVAFFRSQQSKHLFINSPIGIFQLTV